MPSKASPGDVRNLIPARAGIGLRAAHYRELLEHRPDIGWVEVHSENYFGGGQPLWFLERVRREYPVSLHGIGLSLGSADALNVDHLRSLKTLIERCEPCLVSEHLSWSTAAGRCLNDLLPLPYTEEALQVFCDHVSEAQDFLGRQMLIENPSSYVAWRDSTIPEAEFLCAVAEQTGCGILLDVNNVYVSATNHGFDALAYLATIPVARVAEVHLAGFDRGEHCLIDTHGTPVAEPVWALYAEAIRRCGPVPTLIEWDTDLPSLEILLAEAGKADIVSGAAVAVAA
jgi:hypothetical protein